jgi:hypothetical protein
MRKRPVVYVAFGGYGMRRLGRSGVERDLHGTNLAAFMGEVRGVP